VNDLRTIQLESYFWQEIKKSRNPKLVRGFLIDLKLF